MRTPALMFVTVLAVCTLLLHACNSGNTVFEKNAEIPKGNWTYDVKPAFEVPVTDTVSRYNVYVNLRHTNSYTYSNMWVIIYTTLPSGKKLERRTELPLSDKEGKWYGKDSGSIINQQILIQPNAIMPEAGTYRFEFEQNMRVNPLPDVLSIGLSIEKAAPETANTKQQK
ncbi:hypothetical protein BVG80_08645 [Sphingobacteriales bacterium TSM_CSM]|nr:hypothetical protein BVG80_08645 [Sphingobacteriales bacterium TSM_CSM]